MKVNDLLLASRFAAKDSFKEYLNGVYCHDGYLIASDGHRLVRISVNTDFEGIIPIDVVDSFLRQNKKNLLAQVTIKHIREQNNIYEISAENINSPILMNHCVFKSIECKYPEFTKVIDDKVLETDPQRIQYRFQYLADAQKYRTDWIKAQIKAKKAKEKIMEAFAFTWLKGRAVWREPGIDIVIMGINP